MKRAIEHGARWLVPLLAIAVTACTNNSGSTGGGGGGTAAGGGSSGGSGGGGMGGGGGSSMGGGTAMGSGTINDLTAAAMAGSDFHLPLDAALSPDGKTAYFAAVTATGDAAIFTASATTPAAATVLASGDPLASPFGLDVSTDGTTLIVADSAAVDSTGLDHGCLFSLSASTAGTPTVLSGTTGYQPRGVVITKESNADVVYFTGLDATTHEAGVFKVGLAGGSVTVVLKGAPFSDPSGITIAADGTVYTVDTTAADIGHAQLIKVSAGAATVLIPDMAVGYPAGVALSQDEKFVLISALDPAAGTDIVIRYDVMGATSTNYSMTISAFSESAGLKRARNADTYIWADSHANSGGTVYVINKQQ